MTMTVLLMFLSTSMRADALVFTSSLTTFNASDWTYTRGTITTSSAGTLLTPSGTYNDAVLISNLSAMTGLQSFGSDFQWSVDYSGLPVNGGIVLETYLGPPYSTLPNGSGPYPGNVEMISYSVPGSTQVNTYIGTTGGNWLSYPAQSYSPLAFAGSGTFEVTRVGSLISSYWDGVLVATEVSTAVFSGVQFQTTNGSNTTFTLSNLTIQDYVPEPSVPVLLCGIVGLAVLCTKRSNPRRA